MNNGLKDADRDFERLQEMLGALPEMERKSARLLRSRKAAEITALYNKYNAFYMELSLLRLQVKHRTAEDQGFIASMIPVRERVVEQAKEAYEHGLGESGFYSMDDVEKALLPPEDERSLTAEISDYKEEYAALLRKCGALNGNDQN